MLIWKLFEFILHREIHRNRVNGMMRSSSSANPYANMIRLIAQCDRELAELSNIEIKA